MTKEKFIQKWSHSTGEGMMGDLLSVMATECEEIQGAIKLITAESLIKETRIKELEKEIGDYLEAFFVIRGAVASVEWNGMDAKVAIGRIDTYVSDVRNKYKKTQTK